MSNDSNAERAPVDGSAASSCYAIIGQHGWKPASQMPHDTRTVQVAWDDGSFSKTSLAFCDEISGSKSSVRKWWSVSPICLIPNGHVLAWRERQA